MVNIIIIAILSVALVVSIIFSHKLYNDLEASRKEIDKLKGEKETSDAQVKRLKKEKLDELNSTDYTGRKGVYIAPSLSWQEGENAKKLFTVTYEVEILEFTSTKFKIKALSYTVNQSFAADPKHKNSIINYISDRNNWVNRNEVQLIMDDTTKRNIKLEKLLGKD